MLNFADQGSNPCPMQWKCRVSTTGPPGESRKHFLSHCLYQGIFAGMGKGWVFWWERGGWVFFVDALGAGVFRGNNKLL